LREKKPNQTKPKQNPNFAEIQNPRSTNCNTAEIPTVRNKKILIAQTKSEEFSEEFKELLQEPIRNNSRIDLWYSINNETKTKSNVIFIFIF